MTDSVAQSYEALNLRAIPLRGYPTAREAQRVVRAVLQRLPRVGVDQRAHDEQCAAAHNTRSAP